MRVRSLVLAAALAGVGGAARAEDGAPPPAAPAPAVTFSDRRVETSDGFVVFYYTANFVDPPVLKVELDRWKSKDALVEPMQGIPGPPSSPLPATYPGVAAPPVGSTNNVLRIREKKENLPLLEKILELLDQPQPQVLVRAKLVEISYDHRLEWGFEAIFDRAGADPLKTSETLFRSASGTFNPDSFLTSSLARPFQGGTLKFAFLGETRDERGSLDYIVRLLKSRGKAEVLGEPNVLATQGIPATLKAGERVPIQTSNVQSGNIFINTSFEPTGIELTLTPELIGRDAVRMRILQKFSAVTGFVVGQGGVQNPVINNREASTTVTMRDGTTLVIGGLQSTRSQETRSGIPLLMDIPVLGWLFSTRSTQEVKTELYFFVTPEIVRGGYSAGLIRPPSEKERLEKIDSER